MSTNLPVELLCEIRDQCVDSKALELTCSVWHQVCASARTTLVFDELNPHALLQPTRIIVNQGAIQQFITHPPVMDSVFRLEVYERPDSPFDAVFDWLGFRLIGLLPRLRQVYVHREGSLVGETRLARFVAASQVQVVCDVRAASLAHITSADRPIYQHLRNFEARSVDGLDKLVLPANTKSVKLRAIGPLNRLFTQSQICNLQLTISPLCTDLTWIPSSVESLVLDMPAVTNPSGYNLKRLDFPGLRALAVFAPVANQMLFLDKIHAPRLRSLRVVTIAKLDPCRQLITPKVKCEWV